jgi:hypothetical protein
LIGLIAVAILLVQPGYYLVKKIGLSGAFAIVLALSLSLGINATVLFYSSLAFPLTLSFLWAYTIALAVLFFFSRPFITIKINQIERIEKLLLVIFSITLFLTFLICFKPTGAYGTISYHLPAINEFLENGQLPVFENPINGYQTGIMAYPYAMHAAVASFNILTGLELQNYVMFLILLLVGLMLYFLSGENQRTFLAPLFFIVSLIVIIFGTPVLTDTLSTLMFLVGTFFLLKVFEKQEDKFSFMNGVSFGLMLLVKPLGAFFFAGNIAFLFLHKKWRAGIVSIVGFAMVSSIYFLRVILWLPHMGERWGLVSLNAGLNATTYFSNFHILTQSFAAFLFAYIPYLIPILILLAVIRKKGIGKDLILKLAAFYFVFYCIFAPLNIWFYDFIGFSRFIWPVLVLGCIVAAKEAKHLFKREKIIKLISMILIFGIIIGQIGYLGLISRGSRLLPANHGKPLTPYYYNQLKEVIPNTADVKAYYANADNPIIYGFEKITIVDTHAFNEPEGEPCDFLHEENITHVLFWLPGKISPHLFQEFNSKLLESIKKEECGKIVQDYEGWVIVYQTEFD